MSKRKEDTQAYKAIVDIREVLYRLAASGEKSAKHIFNLNFEKNQLHNFDINYFRHTIFNLLKADVAPITSEYSVSAKVISDNTVQIELFLKIIKKEYLKFEV